ncbi:MAG: hypothetical protein IJ814_07880 [Paludibacteraceae bacterium]|nr:hypothetical protein [Paludibacteraceae bacterium]
MNRRRLLHMLEWAVAIAAYVYLFYTLATYEHYDVVAHSLGAITWRHWTALTLCVCLMPVNMALEAWRWKTLIPMPFGEAQRQVYYSKLAGVVTPWRLGEYPARGVMEVQRDNLHPSKEVAAKVLSMGAVGSATMTIAIILAGVTALAFSPKLLALLGESYLNALIAVSLVLAVLLALAPKALRRWAEVNGALLWKSVAQSLVRLACWCIQLALVLFALGADFQFALPYFQLLPVYYLLVTVTPNIPIVEAGVRGAWAICLFGSPNAALAGVLLWVINTLLPCLTFVFLRKKAE